MTNRRFGADGLACVGKRCRDEIWQSGTNRFALEENREIGRNTLRGVPFEAADVPDSIYSDGKLTLKAIRANERDGFLMRKLSKNKCQL